MTTLGTQKFQDGEMIMKFFLPRKFQLKTVPQPLSEDLSVVIVKGGKYAVIKYSGRSTYKNFEKHSKSLYCKSIFVASSIEFISNDWLRL